MKKIVRIFLLMTLFCQYGTPMVSIAQENNRVFFTEQKESHEEKEQEIKKTDLKQMDSEVQEKKDEVYQNNTEINSEEESNAPPKTEDISNIEETNELRNSKVKEIAKKFNDESDYPFYIVNGSFEEPVLQDNANEIIDQSQVPGWMTTASDSSIEIINGTGGGHNFRPAVGKQYAEINANTPGELNQVIRTYPGETLKWELWHAGRDQTDTMNINIGTSENHPTVKTVSSPDRVWTKYTGTYTVPTGQTLTYFGFQSVSSKADSFGNYIDGVRFYVEGNLETNKTSDKSFVYAGSNESLKYTIELKNTSERGILYDVEVKDSIPEGIELIPNTLKVEGILVDNQDTGNKIATTVKEIPSGQTVKVTFDVKVTTSEVKMLKNIATVIDPNHPDEPQYPDTTIYTLKKPGHLASEKTVYNAAGDSVAGQKVTVGDSLEYQIHAKNTEAAETIVNKVKISDAIPVGLTYEAGSLKVTLPDGSTKALSDDQVSGQTLSTEELGSLKAGKA